MTRIALDVLTMVSALLAAAGIAGWIAGYESWQGQPLEVRRISVDYSPLTGGNLRSVHVGIHVGAVYCSADEFEPSMRRDPFILPMLKKAAGLREWHMGAVSDISAQMLLMTFPDSRFVPPQQGDVLAPDWRRLGFRAFRFSSLGSSGFAVVVPCWFLLLLTGLAPANWVRRQFRQRRRRIEGRCSSCGYDLRGSPDRCPECGKACGAANPADASPPTGD
jgi:hypothetical protein